MKRFCDDPEIEVSFVPHNPRVPWPLSWLQRIKYVRTVVTSLCYWATLIVRARRCDVLHVFSASYYSYLLSVAPALLIARLCGRKSVLNYRSGEAEDHLLRWRMTAAPTMRWADVIVVQSAYLEEVFARFGLPARVIKSSISFDHFHFRERRPLRAVFLSTRSLEALYNVGCILRAFALIQQRYPDARLIVAGEGSERAVLEQLALALKLRNVQFIGCVSYDEMPALYDSADIYLNSPNFDNLPSSILESYASGLAVVTTEAGGIPYILRNEETGLMVRLDDHEGLAAAAARLLEDEELGERLVRRALVECADYSLPIEQRAWRELYREIVTGRLDADGACVDFMATER